MARYFVRGGARMAVAALVGGLLACGGDSADPLDPGGGGGGGGGGGVTPVVTTSVSITDQGFNPPDIRVSPGATVTWTWTGGFQHDVSFDAATITDSPLQASGTFSTAMPGTAGTYSYHCSIHGFMTGSVEVQ